MRIIWRLLFCASVFLPVTASADPKSADDWYKEGEVQYNLGNFDKAADAFKQGYAVETAETKKAAYLYNVAQAYRQGKRCKDAVFFYKRYLSLKDQDTVKPLRAERRAEIERWIAELQECEKAQAPTAAKPQDLGEKPDGSEQAKRPIVPPNIAPNDSAEGPNSDDANDGADGEPSAGPHVISLRIAGGLSKISIGSRDVPLQATFALFAGYPFMAGERLQIDIGGAATLAPLPYAIGDMSKTALLTSALGNVGLTYEVASRVGIRGELGAGVLIFSNMGERGNPFTIAAAPTTGALTMLAVRGAIAVDIALTRNVVATATPLAFSYSPAKAGLLEEISSIQRFDFLLGLGYRM